MECYLYTSKCTVRETAGRWDTVKCHGIPWDTVGKVVQNTVGYRRQPVGCRAKTVGYRGIRWDTVGYSYRGSSVGYRGKSVIYRIYHGIPW